MTLKEIVEAVDGKEIVKLNNLNKIQTYVINHIE